MAVEPKYFHAPEGSNGYLQAEVQGETLTARVWWDEDDDEVVVVFQRLNVYPNAYLYIAVAWDTRAVIGTAFAATDRAARRLLLEDLERRGWRFNS